MMLLFDGFGIIILRVKPVKLIIFLLSNLYHLVFYLALFCTPHIVKGGKYV